MEEARLFGNEEGWPRKKLERERESVKSRRSYLSEEQASFEKPRTLKEREKDGVKREGGNPHRSEKYGFYLEQGVWIIA